jgi:DNA-directed RNA polymerase specialized sigma subunit
VLTSKEFDVMRLIYVRGLLPVEVTSELHISAPRVTQLVKSSLAKLRAAITTPFSQN